MYGLSSCNTQWRSLLPYCTKETHQIYLTLSFTSAFSLAGLGLVSMMLHHVFVKNVVLAGLVGLHKTGCSGETKLVLHVPSSSRAGKRLTIVILVIVFSGCIQGSDHTVEIIAAILLPVAILMCVYSLTVFIWRSKAISKKQVSQCNAVLLLFRLSSLAL